MARSTEAQLSLFAEDSPASPTVSPGTSSAQQMTAHSGRKCFESYGRFSPLGSLVRTFLASSRWNSRRCYLTWNAKVTESKRLIFRLAASTPTTYAIESGLLPTPAATQYGSNQGGGSGRTGPKRPGLAIAARMIPTPTAGDAKSAGSRNTESSDANPGLSLTDFVRMDGGEGRADQQQTGKLNPAFVEYLMGYPIGWTDIEPEGCEPSEIQ